MTAADLPAGTNAHGTFDDLLAVSTHSDEDGRVTVTAAGEVDAFTAPQLRSVLDAELQRRPPELVVDLSRIRFLGSAGLAVLVEIRKSTHDRDVALRLIATTPAVLRPLMVTGLIDLFTLAHDGHG